MPPRDSQGPQLAGYAPEVSIVAVVITFFYLLNLPTSTTIIVVVVITILFIYLNCIVYLG